MRDYWNKGWGCRCDVLDIASRRCLAQPRQSYFVITSELRPIIIKVMTDSQKPSWRCATLPYCGKDVKKKTWSEVAGRTFSKDAKKHEGNNVFSEIEHYSMSPDYPRLLFTATTKERQFAEAKGARSCFRCDHCVSRGNFYSFLHHQLVNLLPLQHLIEFILIKTGYRRSWMGQCTFVNIRSSLERVKHESNARIYRTHVRLVSL